MECQRRMRYNGTVRFRLSIASTLLALLAVRAAGGWAAIPPHESRSGPAGGFDVGRREVSVAQFIAFLNAAGDGNFPETAQIARRKGGAYVARRGAGGQAVAEVTAAEAEAFCRWLGRREGRVVRLPTGAEWDAAARGGVDGAPFPWGWGGEPAEMARFDADGPARRGGLFPANGFGLFDMAGNLYEWCAASPDGPGAQRAARGGAWPERNPAMLRVDRIVWFPADYRGRDVGFRVLRERRSVP